MFKQENTVMKLTLIASTKCHIMALSHLLGVKLLKAVLDMQSNITLATFLRGATCAHCTRRTVPGINSIVMQTIKPDSRADLGCNQTMRCRRSLPCLGSILCQVYLYNIII